VRATFTDVRRRLLPEIATARYVRAKATYDRREWAEAEEQFRLALGLIDDPDTAGRLADLRVLAVGFLELSAKAAAPPPPPPAPAPAPSVEPTPVQPVAPPPPATPEPGKVYSLEDTGVLPPVVVRQEIPQVPATVVAMAKPRGLLEVVVDEQGRVISLAMRTSIHPAYDSQVLGAARDWRYQAATFNGHPVKFRKLIQLSVKR
jgi:protein TonB